MLIETNLYIIRSYIETICYIRKHVFCCLRNKLDQIFFFEVWIKLFLLSPKLSCIGKEVQYNWKRKNSS
jgi:hypothetical protein